MDENSKTVNIPLLRKAVEWAEAEAMKPPELCEWEQDIYIADAGENKAPECGTCMCIAGFTARQVDSGCTWQEADDIAAEALGLSDKQAADLFRWRNTIEDVRRIAEDIAGERL